MDAFIRNLQRQHDVDPENIEVARRLIRTYCRIYSGGSEDLETEEPHYIVKLSNKFGGQKWLASQGAQHDPPDVGYKTEKWANEAAVRYFRSPEAIHKVLPYIRAEIILVSRIRTTVNIVNAS